MPEQNKISETFKCKDCEKVKSVDEYRLCDMCMEDVCEDCVCIMGECDLCGECYGRLSK